MSTDCRIFVLSNALMKVLGCEPDIICIAQIAWETINNALPIYNWRLDFFGFMISPQFSAHKNSNVGKILWLRSRNCFRTALVATWSLNGKLIPCCATIIGVSYRYAAETFLKRKLLIPLSKPSIVNRQCVVYSFSCDLCDADYVGYTARHLHQRIAEHKYSAIGRHSVEAHGSNHLLKENQFRVLKKCQGKIWLLSL